MARSIPLSSTSVPLPLYRAEERADQVYFSFNILWEKEPVQEVLAVLEDKGVRAVFFASGEWVKMNQQLAQEILDQGHHLGNHTLTRRNLLLLQEDEVIREISEFNLICWEILEYEPQFFRPPYGNYSGKIVRLAYEKVGCRSILWSLNAMIPGELEPNMDRIEEHLSDGEIFLFKTQAPLVTELLPELIDFLHWKGYSIGDPVYLK